MATLCSAAVPGLAADSKTDTKSTSREFYEIRTYSLKVAKQPILDDYLAKAYIPAVKRHGVSSVGVFVEPAEKDLLHVYVLLVFKSAADVAALAGHLAQDEDYRKAATEFLAAKADDPVYHRIESTVTMAIGGMAKLEKPDPSKPRLLNLRIYESHNERAAAKKVEMFETGELAIFRRVGLAPVFFASSVIGAAMPNLTYLLVFPDENGRKAAWDRFRIDPEWLKLKAIPEFADKEIVSRITNKILNPTAYSEI